MNILMVFIIVLVLGCAHRGYTRGLFGIIYGISTWILIITLASVSIPVIHSFLMKHPAFSGVCYDQLYPVCERIVSSPGYNPDTNSVSDSGMLQDYIESVVGTKEDEKKYDIIFDENATDEEIEEVINQSRPKEHKKINTEAVELCRETTESVMGVAALFVSYLLGKMIMLYFKMIIHGLIERKKDDIPFSINYVGMILGGCEAILYAWVIMAVSSQLWFSTVGIQINTQVAQNSLLTELAANNYIADILF